MKGPDSHQCFRVGGPGIIEVAAPAAKKWYDTTVGRQESMSPDDLRRKAATQQLKQIEILTFDRLLEFALNEQGRVVGLSPDPLAFE